MFIVFRETFRGHPGSVRRGQGELVTMCQLLDIGTDILNARLPGGLRDVINQGFVIKAFEPDGFWSFDETSEQPTNHRGLFINGGEHNRCSYCSFGQCLFMATEDFAPQSSSEIYQPPTIKFPWYQAL